MLLRTGSTYATRRTRAPEDGNTRMGNASLPGNRCVCPPAVVQSKCTPRPVGVKNGHAPQDAQRGGAPHERQKGSVSNDIRTVGRSGADPTDPCHMACIRDVQEEKCCLGAKDLGSHKACLLTPGWAPFPSPGVRADESGKRTEALDQMRGWQGIFAALSNFSGRPFLQEKLDEMKSLVHAAYRVCGPCGITSTGSSSYMRPRHI
jgi:hypothetical protein